MRCTPVLGRATYPPAPGSIPRIPLPIAIMRWFDAFHASSTLSHAPLVDSSQLLPPGRPCSPRDGASNHGRSTESSHTTAPEGRRLDTGALCCGEGRSTAWVPCTRPLSPCPSTLDPPSMRIHRRPLDLPPRRSALERHAWCNIRKTPLSNFLFTSPTWA